MSLLLLLRPLLDSGYHGIEGKKVFILKSPTQIIDVKPKFKKFKPIAISKVREIFELAKKDKETKKINKILEKLDLLSLFGVEKIPVPPNYNLKITLELLLDLENQYKKAEKDSDEALLVVILSLD